MSFTLLLAVTAAVAASMGYLAARKQGDGEDAPPDSGDDPQNKNKDRDRDKERDALAAPLSMSSWSNSHSTARRWARTSYKACHAEISWGWCS